MVSINKEREIDVIRVFFIISIVELNDKKVVDINQTIEFERQKVIWYIIIYIFVPLLYE